MHLVHFLPFPSVLTAAVGPRAALEHQDVLRSIGDDQSFCQLCVSLGLHFKGTNSHVPGALHGFSPLIAITTL